MLTVNVDIVLEVVSFERLYDQTLYFKTKSVISYLVICFGCKKRKESCIFGTCDFLNMYIVGKGNSCAFHWMHVNSLHS